MIDAHRVHADRQIFGEAYVQESTSEMMMMNIFIENGLFKIEC